MKPKISPYLIGLLKENAFYLVLNAVAVALILFVLWVNSGKVYDNTQKADRLQSEVRDLQRRVDLLKGTSLSEESLGSSVKMLTSLVPNTEDYFSVIYALEKLSQKTNFLINSYSINLRSSTKNKLKLTVTGTGDQNAFLKFLSDYNFGGGRLITSDKIELNRQTSGDIKIDITFYSKETKPTTNQKAMPLSRTMIEELAAIRDKIQFGLKEGTEEANIDFSYPRKINPF
jgi:hypothetical protein